MKFFIEEYSKNNKNEENTFEEIPIKEKVRKATKTMLTYGVYALAVFNTLKNISTNGEKVIDKNEDKIEQMNLQKEKNINKRTLIHGPIGYRTKGMDYTEFVDNIYEKYMTKNTLFFDGTDSDFQNFQENIFEDKKLLTEITTKESDIGNKEKDSILTKEEQSELLRERYDKIVKRINSFEMYQYNYIEKSVFDSFESFYEYVNTDKTFIENILKSAKLNERDIDHINIYKKDSIAFNNQMEYWKQYLEEDLKVESAPLLDFSEKEFGQKKIEYLSILKSCNFDIEKIKNKLIENAFKEKYIKIKKNIHEAEIQRKEILEKYTSDTYLKRLILETGNKEEAKKLQQERIKRVSDRGFYISNFSNSVSLEALGHMDYIDGGYVALANESSGETPTHEFSHLGDYGGENIPESTKNKLVENFSTTNLLDYQKENLEYWSNPTEILARKAVFDHELEKLGIKKYSEDFTKEHYKEVQKLLKENNLERNSSQFFRMYERDALIMIMNTVADTDIKYNDIQVNPNIIIDKYMKNFDKNIDQQKITQTDTRTYYPPEWYGDSGQIG